MVPAASEKNEAGMTNPDYWPVDEVEERAALGALILDNRQLQRVYLLNEDYFGLDAHREIFRAISALAARGYQDLDYLEVITELRRRGKLEEIGGVAYVTDLGFGVVICRPMERRAAALREFAVRRGLIKAGLELAESAAGIEEPDLVIAKARSVLDRLGGPRV